MTLTHLRRSRALLAALAVLATVATSLHAKPAEDRAARVLSTQGTVDLQSASPYVERGTLRIQVRAKLGAPDSRIGEDVWLYNHRAVEGSSATGTLVIRFHDGRVKDLKLASQAALAGLLQNQKKPGSDALAKAGK